MALQRLTALRSLMKSHQLAAFIVPTSDAHNSEYIAPCDARRAWLTGFTGSAGTAVVTATQALVWTDGRYYTQFEQEADMQLWTLMKQSLPDTPTLEKWLTGALKRGDVVGADPHTMSREEWTPLQTALSKASISLQLSPNLVDEARTAQGSPAPPRPRNEVTPLPLRYTGKSAGAKLSELREKMKANKACLLVVTALDEVAYTLNLRGSDIDFNPVFFSYLVVSSTDAILFWGDGALNEAAGAQLKAEGANVTVRPYGDIISYLETLAKELSAKEGNSLIWLAADASEAVHRAASGQNVLKEPIQLLSEVSPVALMKLLKNDVELQGFRECHIRDGTAVVRFFRWLHAAVGRGENVTEVGAGDRLLEFRKEEEDFMGPSFETIAGAGPHGAIIHYSASREGPQRVIAPTDLLLVDSGGQYRDGTTDITRTRQLDAAPSAEVRAAFTRVLRGQIAVGTALFPRGVKGNVLDSFARRALWDVGQDYAHGTGHGVGHFLNVHEGPSGISWRPYPRDPGLQPRQILSNEPGYYKVGHFGIRHEDLVETIEVTKSTDHPRASGLVGDYDGRGVLGFHTLTLVPHQRECIDANMLDDFELSYLNAYHARVLAAVGARLTGRGLTDDLAWLARECAPLGR